MYMCHRAPFIFFEFEHKLDDDDKYENEQVKNAETDRKKSIHLKNGVKKSF